jgi:hypothetical protein
LFDPVTSFTGKTCCAFFSTNELRCTRTTYKHWIVTEHVVELGVHFQVIQDVALKSAPVTSAPGLAQFVSIDAPSSAPASNVTEETSPHMHALSDPAFRVFVNTALEQMCVAIQSASAHRDSLQSLRSMLQWLRQLRKENIQKSCAEGSTGVDGLKSLLQKLASCRYELSNIMVRQPTGLFVCSGALSVQPLAMLTAKACSCNHFMDHSQCPQKSL